MANGGLILDSGFISLGRDILIAGSQGDGRRPTKEGREEWETNPLELTSFLSTT